MCCSRDFTLGRPRCISPFSILSETVARQKEGMEGGKGWTAGRTPHTPTNGRWGMNRGRGCGMTTSTATALAAWVIPCLWPKKGTHSREQEVDGEGQRARGRWGSIIGETIYTRRVQLQSDPTFPRKTTETFARSALRTEKVLFDFKAERNSSPISNSGSSRPTKRRDFFRRCKYGDKPAINDDDDDDEHRGGETRRGGEKCVVAGFQRRAKKGPPSDPRPGRVEWRGDALTGVKRSPFSADYFARGALFLPLTPILHLSTPRRMPAHLLPHAHFSRTVNLTPHT